MELNHSCNMDGDVYIFMLGMCTGVSIRWHICSEETNLSINLTSL